MKLLDEGVKWWEPLVGLLQAAAMMGAAIVFMSLVGECFRNTA